MNNPIDFMQQFPKENFSNPAYQQAFIQDAADGRALQQKELSVNQAEQTLLLQRIELMKGLINDLPSSDPQYSMLLIQVQMDQIELDELRVRADILIQNLGEKGPVN